MIAIFLIVTPALDHDHPTREQGIAVVEYWEAEATWFESNSSDGIHEAIKHLTGEVISWGEKYDAHQTKRLQRSLLRLLKVKEQSGNELALQSA